jgi:probable rRNA maturation factor
MLDLQIASQSKNIPSKKQFQQWFELVSKQQKIHKQRVTIRIVNKAESQRLNKRYRHKNKPTNVLSFTSDPSLATLGFNLLGDIVICAPIVEQEAQKQGKNPLHHWAHLVIHGILHLLGYDHIENLAAQKMESIEIKLLAKLHIPNPYELS